MASIMLTPSEDNNTVSTDVTNIKIKSCLTIFFTPLFYNYSGVFSTFSLVFAK